MPFYFLSSKCILIQLFFVVGRRLYTSFFHCLPETLPVHTAAPAYFINNQHTTSAMTTLVQSKEIEGGGCFFLPYISGLYPPMRKTLQKCKEKQCSWLHCHTREDSVGKWKTRLWENPPGETSLPHTTDKFPNQVATAGPIHKKAHM